MSRLKGQDRATTQDHLPAGTCYQLSMCVCVCVFIDLFQLCMLTARDKCGSSAASEGLENS